MWQERAKPSNRSYAGVNLGGVPVEHMVLLANLVGAGERKGYETISSLSRVDFAFNLGWLIPFEMVTGPTCCYPLSKIIYNSWFLYVIVM
jgi:hypothetical protein